MPQCCGKNCASNFCPDCGAKVNAGPLHSLLAHVRQMKQKNATEAYRLSMVHLQMGHQAKSDKFTEARMKRIGESQLSKERLVEKWESWEAALEEIIMERTAK